MERFPTYVISLDRAKEKYKRVERDFSAIGIQVQRFPGVYAKELPKEYLESVVHPYALYTIDNGRKIDPEISTLGAVGCYLSHVELWKKLLESEEEVMHVVEDDATVLATVEEMNEFIQSVPSDWDIIYLGFFKMHPLMTRGEDVELSNRMYRINSPTYQTHSYVINRRGAEKLLSKAFPIVHHVDSYMSFMAMKGGLNAYRPRSAFLIQDQSLGTDVSLKEFSLNETLVTILRLPPALVILTVFIAILFIVSYLIKGVAKKFK